MSGHVALSGPFEGISLIVDGTDCPVDRPQYRADREILSNGRTKENIYGRYNFKYTVGCQISTGKICTVMGPDGGSKSDIKALREGFAAIVTSWDPFEVMLADKGYQGHWRCLSPFKGRDKLPEEDAFNEVLASVRILVECTLKRIKQFGVLGNRGRYRCNRESHRQVFNVCCQITNICLDFEPTWQHTNWYLLAIENI